MTKRVRPPFAETTPCAQGHCGHALSAHVDGTRNPFPWMGPEYPTGCNYIYGVGDAGYDTCACHAFIPPKDAKPLMCKPSIPAPSIALGIGRHYKGDDYEVLGISWDATNGRDRWVVRYRGIGNADTGHENVQDVDEFLGTVQLPSGETVPRYKFLGPDAAGERG